MIHRVGEAAGVGRAGVVLVKAALQWRADHHGTLPATSSERTAFRDLLRSWQRSVDGVPLEVSLVVPQAVLGR